jgi:hypothetical protein
VIWGLGTGRCGTRSLAAQLHGLHEPHPTLHHVVEARRGDAKADARLRDAIEKRLALGAPAISDWRNSFAVPWIRAVDPEPEWFWLVREPVACVTSLRYMGSFVPDKTWATGLASGTTTQVEQAAYYWIATNGLILTEMNRRPPTERLRVMEPWGLVEHRNSSPPRTPLNRDEAAWVHATCRPLWDTIRLDVMTET